MQDTVYFLILDKVFVPNTESVMTSKARKALEVIDQILRAHHHLECRDRLLACRTKPRTSKQPMKGKPLDCYRSKLKLLNLFEIVGRGDYNP